MSSAPELMTINCISSEDSKLIDERIQDLSSSNSDCTFVAPMRGPFQLCTTCNSSTSSSYNTWCLCQNPPPNTLTSDICSSENCLCPEAWEFRESSNDSYSRQMFVFKELSAIMGTNEDDNEQLNGVMHKFEESSAKSHNQELHQFFLPHVLKYVTTKLEG